MTWIKKKFVLFLSLLLSIQVSLQPLPGNWSIGRGRQLLSLLGQFTAAFIPLRAIHDTSEQAKHQPSGTVGIGCCAASLYLFSSLGNITAAELCPQSSVDLPWLAPEHVSCRRCLLLSFGSGGSAGEVCCREVFWGEHTPERIKLKEKKTCCYIFLASSCMELGMFLQPGAFPPAGWCALWKRLSSLKYDCWLKRGRGLLNCFLWTREKVKVIALTFPHWVVRVGASSMWRGSRKDVTNRERSLIWKLSLKIGRTISSSFPDPQRTVETPDCF